MNEWTLIWIRPCHPVLHCQVLILDRLLIFLMAFSTLVFKTFLFAKKHKSSGDITQNVRNKRNDVTRHMLNTRIRQLPGQIRYQSHLYFFVVFCIWIVYDQLQLKPPPFEVGFQHSEGHSGFGPLDLANPIFNYRFAFASVFYFYYLLFS